jgi:prephenate dehydrogenase
VEWIERIGAVPRVLGPEEHDRIVAYTSHLPQLAATALAALLEGRAEPRSGVFGPALVDSTRLALSPFDVWGDILATNRGPILEALGAYLVKLEEFCRDFEPAPMRAQFERASKLAAFLRDASQGST